MRAALGVSLFAMLCLAASAMPARAERPGFDPQAVYKVPLGNAPAVGPAEAPVTIVSWSDHACGYCYRVQPTLDRLARLYPEQLRWVHRTLPLDDDETLAAEAALAAGAQGRFRPMNDRLYALAGEVDRAAVELLARELGLDMVRFRAELDGRVYRAQIRADMADARALGVDGTPAFFVNGRALLGSHPLISFVEVVEQELARAAAQPGGYAALVGAGRPSADGAAEPADEARARRVLQPTASYRVGLGLPGHQSGPDDALVTLVVWSDFQCPFCARVAPVLARLRERFKGDLRIVFRHFAMPSHRSAAIAAEAAIAAAEQGKFWAFHDQMFGSFGNLARADLERFAAAAGLDLPRFRAALDDRRYHDAVIAELGSAEALGIDSTPTMFLNGAPVLGARDVATMERLVDAHLTRSRELVASGIARGDLYAVLMGSARGDERADPSRVPTPASVKLELRGDDRMRAVAAACRRGDAARATALAAPLAGEPRRRAAWVCAGAGIDLPRE